MEDEALIKAIDCLLVQADRSFQVMLLAGAAFLAAGIGCLVI